LLGKIKKNILISTAIAGLIYLGFTLYADINELIKAFRDFNWLLFPVLLLLSYLNYLSRFVKWDYYLKIINVEIKKSDSFFIFMSGLVMSVTPGKMGELLKAYLVKQVTGAPVSKTAPVIFAERITDLVSLILIALAGAYAFDYGKGIVIAVGIFFLLLLVFISNRTISVKVMGLAEKSRFLKKHISKIHLSYESAYSLLKPTPLILMTGLSLVSWFLECLGYYLILLNFGTGLSLLWSAFSYAFATIIGAISMLPGGLGITEGSLTFFLIQNNISNEVAVASTFIIRVVTLWFAVIVGIISVIIYQKRFGKIKLEQVPLNLQENENAEIQKD
jgi:glycosyltransferase 2 family protein